MNDSRRESLTSAKNCQFQVACARNSAGSITCCRLILIIFSGLYTFNKFNGLHLPKKMSSGNGYSDRLQGTITAEEVAPMASGRCSVTIRFSCRFNVKHKTLKIGPYFMARLSAFVQHGGPELDSLHRTLVAVLVRIIYTSTFRQSHRESLGTRKEDATANYHPRCHYVYD